MINTPQNEDTLRLALRASDAAKAIGVSERTLFNLIETKGLPVVRVGGLRLFPVRQLEAWLAKHVEYTQEAGA